MMCMRHNGNFEAFCEKLLITICEFFFMIDTLLGFCISSLIYLVGFLEMFYLGQLFFIYCSEFFWSEGDHLVHL